MRNTARHCWSRALATLLLAALAVVVLQDPAVCQARSEHVPPATSRVQSGVPRLDATTRSQVLTEVAATIRDQYADPQVGDSPATTLLANLEQGRYDSVADPDSLVALVMAVIRSRVPDRHFDFSVGRNIGGSGDMVILLCSHLLEERSLLYRVYGRSGGPPGEVRAAASGRHFGPAIPVFVLTSGATVSAAEALAYILQDYGRTTLVGERTAGMANPSRTFSIGEEFELTVPFLLFRYGRSGGTFAGVGVAPDIAVPADSALDVAQAEIARKLEFR